MANPALSPGSVNLPLFSATFTVHTYCCSPAPFLPNVSRAAVAYGRTNEHLHLVFEVSLCHTRDLDLGDGADAAYSHISLLARRNAWRSVPSATPTLTRRRWVGHGDRSGKAVHSIEQQTSSMDTSSDTALSQAGSSGDTASPPPGLFTLPALDIAKCINNSTIQHCEKVAHRVRSLHYVGENKSLDAQLHGHRQIPTRSIYVNTTYRCRMRCSSSNRR